MPAGDIQVPTRAIVWGHTHTHTHAHTRTYAHTRAHTHIHTELIKAVNNFLDILRHLTKTQKFNFIS